MFIYSLFIFILNLCRKSSSWHTSLRIRKKSERKDKEAKKDTKLENGYRKSRDGLANKVSVKVRVWTNVDDKVFYTTSHCNRHSCFRSLCFSFSIQTTSTMVRTKKESVRNCSHLQQLVMIFKNFFFISPVAPEFLVPLSDVTCDTGESAVLRCKVCGRPRAAVTWKGPDQSNLTNNGHYSMAYR